MSRASLLLKTCFLVAWSTLACSPSPENPPDAGTTAPDAGTPSSSNDAGTDGGDLPTGPGVRFNPLVRIVDEGSQVTEMQEGAYLDSPPPAALVPDGDGGFQEFRARHVGVDGYVIPGVAEGPYYLRFNDTYLWTDEREVQLRTTIVQRPDLNWSVPAGTALRLKATGLVPWQATDLLRLSAPNGGSASEDRRFSTAEDFGGTPPAPGATQLDVRIAGFVTLPEGSKGDSLWVQQLSGSPGLDGGLPFTALVRSTQQTAFTLVPGETTSLDVALAEQGQQRTLAFTVDGAAFQAQARATHPEASGLNSLSWAIGTRPGSEPFARLGSHPELAFASVPIDVPLAPYTVRYRDAFPGSWLKVGHVSARTLARLTSGTSSWSHPLSVARYEQVGAMEVAGTLAPRLGPPRNVRINGQPASGPLSGVGGSPVVSWDAPELGTPTRYFVHVVLLRPQGNGFVPQPGRAYVVTSGTEVRLPPALVAGGSPFVLKVTAARGAGTRSPYEGELPLDVAETTTGILTR